MCRFYLSNRIQLETLNQIEYVSNYYVYEWRDCNSIFYVGMGRNRRAWNEHLSLPENRRRTATNFMVSIYRDGLTKAQAHLLERHHIRILTNRGITLINERIPDARTFTKSK